MASKLPLVGAAFSRLRDGMVSDQLKVIYMPIPKSACTLFATFVALHSDKARDFDPERHSIHGYRQNKEGLTLRDFGLFHDPEYFRFTVIRDPFTRLVSAYVDKIVKPIRAGRPWAEQERYGRYSFEEVVNILCDSTDGEIEKHFRPQICFLRSLPLDHIGKFEDLESTFSELNKRLGLDVRGDVVGRVKDPKRTDYQNISEEIFVGGLTARELAGLPEIPHVTAFYNERLRSKVRERYKEDIELYRRASLSGKQSHLD